MRNYIFAAIVAVSLSSSTVRAQCTVDWNNVHQRIDGFGASSAWRTSLTTPQADLLFSTNKGIVYTDNLSHVSTNNGVGLSLLRTRIVPDGTTIENSIMQMAQARGARVWSAPWTPPAGFKSSGALDGGNYLGSGANATNLAYARQLANYVVNMKSAYGINLYAISRSKRTPYQPRRSGWLRNVPVVIATDSRLHDEPLQCLAGQQCGGNHDHAS
jgi:O-glycosyl hydrolase